MNGNPVWSWLTSWSGRRTPCTHPDPADMGTAFGLDASMEGQTSCEALQPWGRSGYPMAPLKEERPRPR